MSESVQRALAVAALENASTRAERDQEAATRAWNAYNQTRRIEPGGLATDQARRAWADAVSAVIAARVEEERARDEFNALTEVPEGIPNG
jgi:hypothetical protein